jgi:lysophospholipase L1-like esterase
MWDEDQARKAREGMSQGWRSSAGAAPLAVALGLVLSSCGGGNELVTPPPPVDTFFVSGFVYWDENRNNVADADETIRLGEVEVEIAGRSGVSAQQTGRFEVQGVPAGTLPVGVRAPSLPPFFVAGAPAAAQVPGSAPVPVPVALPIGGNTPFVYLAEGDSISQGQGSSDGRGYRVLLESRLEAYYGRQVATYYRGNGGGTSEEGAARIARDLRLLTPAYTLVMWGTNDWNSCGDPRSCFTVENLRTIVREVKAAGSLPMVATIPPANVGFDGNAPPARNAWVAEANTLIRAMAQQEGAQLVDVNAAFLRQPSLSALFVDHVHPNPAGHRLIADTFFEAITKPRSLTASD